MHTAMQVLCIPGSCFELPEDTIAKDESHNKTRYASYWRCCIPHVTFRFTIGGNRRGLTNVPSCGGRLDLFRPLVHTPNGRTATVLQ